MTLLPSGTYKGICAEEDNVVMLNTETMRNDELDIMFVPVYLQAHFLMKSIFWYYLCCIYVRIVI